MGIKIGTDIQPRSGLWYNIGSRMGVLFFTIGCRNILRFLVFCGCFHACLIPKIATYCYFVLSVLHLSGKALRSLFFVIISSILYICEANSWMVRIVTLGQSISFKTLKWESLVTMYSASAATAQSTNLLSSISRSIKPKCI